MQKTLFASQLNIADVRAAADIIEEVSPTLTYLGFCEKGTATIDEPKFSILKIEHSGTVKPITTTFKWAKGLCSYHLAWTGRAGYDYEFRKF